MDNPLLIPIVSNTVNIVIAGVMFIHFNKKINQINNKLDQILFKLNDQRDSVYGEQNIPHIHEQCGHQVSAPVSSRPIPVQNVNERQKMVDNTCSIASNITNALDNVYNKVFQQPSSNSSASNSIESSIIPGNIVSSTKVSSDISRELSSLESIDEIDDELSGK